MTVLIIDRDRASIDQLAHTLGERDVPFEVVSTRDQGIEALRQKDFDAVIFDPAPQNEIRPFVLGARRMARKYPYIILTSHTVDHQKALAAGCNDFLAKPMDGIQLHKKIAASQQIGKLILRLNDTSEDFPSKDGVIAKSAFNQLFISCIDRADRYGEQSFIIFIRIENFDEIITAEGQAGLSGPADALKKYITRIRRLSDIAGQLTTHEFALLLFGTSNNDEPFLAANRFAESLRDFHDLISCGKTNAVLNVSLMAIPSGNLMVEHRISGKNEISTPPL